jgi:hypothetical protein
MLILKSIKKYPDRSMVHPCGIPPSIHFHYAHGCQNPDTRTTVRLLGPCFKTGQLKPFRQHPAHVSDTPHPVTPPGQRPASSSSSRKKTRIEDPAKRHVWQLLSPGRQVTRGYNSPRRNLPSPRLCLSPKTDADLQPQEYTAQAT